MGNRKLGHCLVLRGLLHRNIPMCAYFISMGSHSVGYLYKLWQPRSCRWHHQYCNRLHHLGPPTAVSMANQNFKIKEMVALYYIRTRWHVRLAFLLQNS